MISVQWLKGYTQAELDSAQRQFGLEFPPDLIALLREKRPAIGHNWTNDAEIRRALAWPFEGLLFDVEHNFLWWPEWGTRPTDANERKEILRSVVSRAPKLIPLVGHRYLPEEPREQGNPVFSVYQSDVIYYGTERATAAATAHVDCQRWESNHGQIGWVACQFDFRRYPDSYPCESRSQLFTAFHSASCGARSGIEPPTFGG